MKKAILIIALMFATCTISLARDIEQGTFQISGGTKLVNGNLELEVDNTKVADSDIFEIDFGGSYYFTKNIGLGAIFVYQNDDTSFGGGSFDETTMTVIGPQVIGQMPFNERSNFYLTGMIGILTMEGEDEFGQYLDASATAFGIGAGIAMFPIDSISVNIGLDYLTADGDEDIANVDVELTTLDLGISLSAYF